MKICFCSTFLTNEVYAIKNSKVKPSVSTHNFNINLLEGIRENIGEDLTIINTEIVASYPNYKKAFIETSEEKNKVGSYLNVGKVNLPVLKHITETINLYKTLKKWIKGQDSDEIFICAYGRRFSQVVAINLLQKRYKHTKTCMVLADLSGDASCKIANKNNLKFKIHENLLEFQVKQSRKFDSFVFLTEAMATYLEVEDKPYTIIEGIGPKELTDEYTVEINKSNDKIMAYAGVLSSQYSVDLLIDAFLSIKKSNYKLWIFGDGELKDQIIELSKKHSNIIFFGFIPNEVLKMKLLEATVLINPRQNTEEYTKYSFPSKIIEYFTLSKPVIGYKLDGIPDEYEDYIYYVKDNSMKSLQEKIIEVCELPEQELLNIGKRNKEFVLRNKNSVIQTKKVIRMFTEMNSRSESNDKG